ncbi:MAG TPA: cyclophilin-like fold protein [Thermodesulfovibrionales bacterium]|nr:cyclophilin-like fold protein [Thermodesulfovibrionales bacterium]
MPTKVRILIGDIAVDADLLGTICAKAIADVLPVETIPNEWGDEFYFEIPVKMDLDETATRNVKAGDIGYWPPGNALAIFFGPTPMSTGQEPIPASEVNLVGRITGDAALLRKAKGSRRITIERRAHST